MPRTKILFATTCLLLAVAVLGSHGQGPPAKLGYMRFWDMLPPASGAFELCKAGESESGGNLLSGSAYRYSSYVEFPPGRYHLAVFKKGDRKSPIKIVDVDLRPDTYFTILMSPRAGTINVEVIDDTIDPKATSGTLIVRNYFTGLTVAVSSDTQKIVDALPYGQSHAATGFPLSRVPLTLHTRLPNGTPAESGAEADFHASKHATLLVIPDTYGRFRPRVAIDGSNP